MALFNLVKRRPEAPIISEEVLNKPFIEVRGENVLRAPGEINPPEPEPIIREPIISVKRDSIGPYSEISADNNPFRPDVLSFENELEDIKVQLKSISLQISNIVKTIDNLEKAVKKEEF